MIGRLFWFACLWLCVCVDVGVHVHVHARSIVSITSPDSVKQKQLLGQPIDHRPAVFGNPPYGSFLSGVLWYPNEQQSPWGCDAITPDSNYPSNSAIVMLKRSPPDATGNHKCSFVTKVRNAWLIGAIAVVIINYDDVNMPYMADDGTGSSLPTPAVLITDEVGTLLTQQMRNNTFTSITMQIGWQLPSVNGAVSWQLWTAAYDSKSSSFKSVFGPADAVLHMATSFEPMYHFVRGDSMPQKCRTNWQSSTDCQDLCEKQGRYCAADPDGVSGWLSGLDVVRENVWQMCLWKQLVNVSGSDPTDIAKHMTKNKWWSYVSTSESECDTREELEGDVCRQRVLDMTGLVPESQWYQPISECYKKCLKKDDATECPMIEHILKERDDQGIFYLPTLVINQEAIRGALSCNRPLETRSCQVLYDICQGYNSTLRRTVPVCVAPVSGCDFGLPKDCGGECVTASGGSINGLDACGSCLKVGSRAWNKSCIDCAGQVNGENTIDQCGLCLLPTDPKRDASCKDCHGTIWGKAKTDCAGVCEGGAAFDECGACIRADQRSAWNQSCTDCRGVFRGSAKLDACNVCNGDGKSCGSSTNWGAVIAIVLAVAGVVGAAIYVYMKRQQNRMREDIDGILKQYLPLQDGNTGSGHIRPTQRLSGHENL